MVQSNVVAGFLSRVLESVVLPARVNLPFQREVLSGPANGWPHRFQSGRALSRD
jgi:hypothetical protein